MLRSLSCHCLAVILLLTNRSYSWTSTCRQQSRLNLLMSTVEPPAAISSVSSGATVLRCEGLTKSFTGVPQFQDIKLVIGKGARTGVIGVNGAGKSTLLKCLAKIENADAGNIETATNANVIYVDQEPDWGNIFVYEALFSGTDNKAESTRKYFKALDPSAEMDADAFTDATDAMESSSAWDYQEQGLNIAEKLNIQNDKMYRLVNSLSGGEKKRVGLSAALLKQPDILLLDEPTNHLDIDALEFLAEYLKPGGKDKDMAMLLVTHDRFFLERVCTEIVELDRAQVHRYPGNYARYLELREARLIAEDAESDRARTKLRRESEWMAKQPRARQAKSKARQYQFYELVEAAKGRGPDKKKIELQSAEEKEKQKRLGGVVAEFRAAKYLMGERTLLEDFSYNFRQRDRIAIVGNNGVGKSTFLKVLTGNLPLTSGTVRIGDTVTIGYYEQTGLQLTPEQEKQPVLKFVQEAVEKAAPQEVLSRGIPKLAVETTEATGRRNIRAGKGDTINAQVVTEVKQSNAVSERDAMNLLSRFQFPKTRWYDRLGQLSGGERRRIQLLQVLARSPNVLLLDEPSNDLDLQTLSALEEYLTEVFEGCLVVVSHDNFFVNRVAEHLFVFEGDGVVRDFEGSYTDYLEYRSDVAEDKKKEAALARKEEKSTSGTSSSTTTISSTASQTTASTDTKTPSPPKTSTKQSTDISSNGVLPSQPIVKDTKKSNGGNKLTFPERKEMNKLEKEIEKLGGQIQEYEDKLAKCKEGYTVLAELTNEMNKLVTLLATKEERWVELADMDAGLD